MHSMTIRTRPDRVLPYLFDALSAEVARQCIEEWASWRDYGHGDRAGACQRMAVLVDLGAQQAAIMLERRTGHVTAPWSPKRHREKLARELDGMTEGNPEDLAEATIRRIRIEVERPWFRWHRQHERKSA